jgi:hypothetical protein
MFHLLNGCPAMVLPVKANAPILAWSPWTLLQMRAPSTSGYKPEVQHEQLCEWLDTIISLDHVSPNLRGRYEDILGRCVSMVINGAVNTKGVASDILSKIDPERAGIAMFRY